uniref:Putative secreted protein n=1 Tax=Ixodes ricinus TaxID=34613 RepID=A0A6B0U322_IXORI
MSGCPWTASCCRRRTGSRREASPIAALPAAGACAGPPPRPSGGLARRPRCPLLRLGSPATPHSLPPLVRVRTLSALQTSRPC